MQNVRFTMVTGLVFMVGFVALAVAQQRGTDQLPIASGPDIGFRVERMEGGRAVGTFFVKLNGQWVEAVPVPKATTIR